jgi:hypothetical protein
MEEHMTQLQIARLTMIIIVATMAVLVLGDYLGYKIRRWRLATIAGSIALVSVIAFAIYAAIVLT